MDLTQENQDAIDGKGIEQLIAYLRFAPAGDPWFEGATGLYWLRRIAQLRSEDREAFINASLRVGWVLDLPGLPAMDFSKN